MDAVARSAALAAYAAETAGCVRCRLAETRSQVVFGSGNPDAELMIVGEAPGYSRGSGWPPVRGPGRGAARAVARRDRARRRSRVPRERPQVPPAAEPRPARGRDRRVRAAPLPSDRARAAACGRHARELRHEAPLRALVRDHPRPRPGAGGDALVDDRPALPALPPGGRALHAVDAEGAGGRFRAAPCPARSSAARTPVAPRLADGSLDEPR